MGRVQGNAVQALRRVWSRFFALRPHRGGVYGRIPATPFAAQSLVSVPQGIIERSLKCALIEVEIRPCLFMSM
ncbi:MAG: hypothetical protein AAF822_10875 [Pseudomonadota bacterium]